MTDMLEVRIQSRTRNPLQEKPYLIVRSPCLRVWSGFDPLEFITSLGLYLSSASENS
jgi:hypothetical protein